MDPALHAIASKGSSNQPGYLLYQEDELRDFVTSAVRAGQKLGASAVTAYAAESAGITMQNREGRTENAVRSGSQSLVVQVFLGGRSGVAVSGALSAATVRMTAESAVRIAQLLEVDEAAGPADPAWLYHGEREIPLFAPSGLSAGKLGEASKILEDHVAALAGGRKLRVLETGAASEDMRWARAISPDFSRSGSESNQLRWCSVIAEQDGRMALDSWSSTDRRTDHLADLSVIAERAVERTLRKTGARGLATRRCPVLLDATIAASFVNCLVGALTGGAQEQQMTFLPEALGHRALAPHLDLVEDPFEPYGLASGMHDSEGVASRARHVVCEGVIEGYFLSSRTARKLGLDPTGNASGPWNLHFTSRNAQTADDLPGMLRRLHRGLWVTEILGGGVNPVTGNYSQAISGLWVEDGEPVFPVEDITIAGDLPKMLANIHLVGVDVHRSGRIRTGSILIDTMQIAGR